LGGVKCADSRKVKKKALGGPRDERCRYKKKSGRGRPHAEEPRHLAIGQAQDKRKKIESGGKGTEKPDVGN